MSKQSMDVKPWQAALIIGFFVIVFGLITYFITIQASTTGARILHTRDGLLNVLVGNQILRYDAKGGYSEIKLETYGIHKLMGGFDFYSNGDILLRAQADDLGFFDKLAVFFRGSGRLTTPNTDATLMRCRTQGDFACQPIGSRISFERSFRPFILDNDQVLIADTSRHRLLWLDAQGTLADSLDTGFRFPNKIGIHDGNLYVANTNRNQLSWVAFDALDRAGMNFPAIDDWESWSLSQGESGAAKDTFPTEFVISDKGVVVLSQGQNLKLGNLYYFDYDGDQLNAAEKPEGADIISIALFRGEILAADFTRFKIYRFSQTGQYLGELVLPELQAVLNAQAQAYARYDTYILWTAVVAVVVFIFFFAIAVWLEKTRQQKAQQALVDKAAELQDEQGEAPDFGDPDVQWLRPHKRLIADNPLIKWLINLFLIVLMTLTAAIMIDVLPAEKHWFVYLSVFGLVVILALLMVWERRLKVPKFGVKGAWLLLQNSRGKRAVMHIREVAVCNKVWVLGQVHLNLMQGKYPRFLEADTQRYLDPLEPHARKIGALQLFVYLWKKRDPETILGIIAVCIVLGFMLLDVYAG